MEETKIELQHTKPISNSKTHETVTSIHFPAEKLSSWEHIHVLEWSSQSSDFYPVENPRKGCSQTSSSQACPAPATLPRQTLAKMSNSRHSELVETCPKHLGCCKWGFSKYFHLRKLRIFTSFSWTHSSFTVCCPLSQTREYELVGVTSWSKRSCRCHCWNKPTRRTTAAGDFWTSNLLASCLLNSFANLWNVKFVNI